MTLAPEHVPPDGDCLFHAVFRILKDVPSLSGVYTSPHQLRERVALAALTSPRADSFLRGWVELHRQAKAHKEPDMLMETMHVEHVYEDLTVADKYVAAAAMLDKYKYWGEEFALLTLEECLGVRFLVLDPITKHLIAREHGNTNARHVGILQLSNVHYEPMVEKETKRAAWTPDLIPALIEQFQSSSES